MTEHLSGLLNSNHVVTEFDSGQPSLDDWLRGQAARAQQQGTARTWVWTRAHSQRVLAFFSITPTQIARDRLTSAQAGGASVVPAFLLARLALDRSLQGGGYGGELLRDALERLVTASDQVGGRLIVVDAIDEQAEGFYQHYGFAPTLRTASESRSVEDDVFPRRMVIKIATVRKALGLPASSSRRRRVARSSPRLR